MTSRRFDPLGREPAAVPLLPSPLAATTVAIARTQMRLNSSRVLRSGLIIFPPDGRELPRVSLTCKPSHRPESMNSFKLNVNILSQARRPAGARAACLAKRQDAKAGSYN